MMVVPIATEPRLTAGTPKVLFDVPPDGQRLLMIKESESTDASALPIILVENWFEELKRLVPTN